MHSGKVILITGGTGQVGAAAAAAPLRRVHGVFCVPPLVTSFMPAGSFERQMAGSKNVIDAAADANVAHCVLSTKNSARPMNRRTRMVQRRA